MLTPQMKLAIHDEIIVDLFAGGGGASTGIEQATGFPPDIAINHDPDAIGMHMQNHPQTKHFCSDVFEVEPIKVCEGRRVGLLWASPDCRHFSRAKGAAPVSKQVRSLAWIVVRWAKAVRPRIICLENVEEFQTWGRLGKDNLPDPRFKGETFKQWVESLKGLGYAVDWRVMRASDYGTPTIRKRLFLVARCDGLPIVWPEPTHGDPSKPETKAKNLKPWHTAAECIDWSLPCPSIFERKKPLAEATLRRIARGIVKYVIEAKEPFIVELAHAEVSPSGVKRWGKGIRSVRQPLQTVMAGGNGAALCVPVISSYYGHKSEGGEARGSSLDYPLKTQTTENRHALVSAFLTKHYGTDQDLQMNEPLHTITTKEIHSTVKVFLTEHANASTQRNMSVDEPLRTQCAQVKGGHFAAVAANLVTLRGASKEHSVDAPLNTISAGGIHSGLVAALLIKYYGTDQDPQMNEPLHTITTKDRFGLVIVHIDGEPYVITDIGMRMLQPHELFAAQGFPKNYIIDRVRYGRKLTKTAQVRLAGNSVCQQLAKAIVAANYADVLAREAA